MDDEPVGEVDLRVVQLRSDEVLCRCGFRVSDVADAWSEVLDDSDAELPPAVLEEFLGSARLVEDVMCERGYEAIRSILESIRAGRPR